MKNLVVILLLVFGVSQAQAFPRPLKWVWGGVRKVAKVVSAPVRNVTSNCGSSNAVTFANGSTCNGKVCAMPVVEAPPAAPMPVADVPHTQPIPKPDGHFPAFPSELKK